MAVEEEGTTFSVSYPLAVPVRLSTNMYVLPDNATMLIGVALTVAVPPLILSTKSFVPSAPLLPLVLKTASLKVNVIVELWGTIETPVIVGGVVSNTIVSLTAVELPAASMNST